MAQSPIVWGSSSVPFKDADSTVVDAYYVQKPKWQRKLLNMSRGHLMLNANQQILMTTARMNSLHSVTKRRPLCEDYYISMKMSLIAQLESGQFSSKTIIE